jgi:cholest-4-en-3-one 26-monooxygenase
VLQKSRVIVSSEAAVPEPLITPDLDLTDPDLYASRMPHAEFAELRRAAPVRWNPQPTNLGFNDAGFWAVTRHRDVVAISRDSETWSTAENTAIVRLAPGSTREQVEMQRVIMLNTDPPHHTKVRGIVSRGFTPRAINNLREVLAERAAAIVATALQEGSGDFVTDVACELPLQAIAELLGVPQSDRHKLFTWSNQMVGYDDPEYTGDGEQAAAEILGYSMVMAEDRRACPRNDIVTKLVNAQVDGDELSTDEFGFFVILLSVAGNETTRNAISHGMLAFLDNPEQWELFKASRPATAVDEIVRWATPVTVFQRTATRDTEVGGQPVCQGERVGLFYRSANFDEEVFDHPERFDVMRSPNPHVGFGGTGAHYCLGANLARLEIDLIFNAIADAIPGISKAGDPQRLRSGWLNGVKRLPVSYS